MNLTLNNSGQRLTAALVIASIVAIPNIICLPFEIACACTTGCQLMLIIYFIIRASIFFAVSLTQLTFNGKHATLSPQRLFVSNIAISATGYLLLIPLSAFLSQYIPTDIRGSILLFQFLVTAFASFALGLFVNQTKADHTNNTHRSETLNDRLLVADGDKIHLVDVDTIAFIYSSCRKTSITTNDGKTYRLSKSLDSIMTGLNSELFYRVNKQFIVSKKSVKELVVWFDSRILVKIEDIDTPEPIYVSKNRAADFKKWFAR